MFDGIRNNLGIFPIPNDGRRRYEECKIRVCGTICGTPL